MKKYTSALMCICLLAILVACQHVQPEHTAPTEGDSTTATTAQISSETIEESTAQISTTTVVTTRTVSTTDPTPPRVTMTKEMQITTTPPALAGQTGNPAHILGPNIPTAHAAPAQVLPEMEKNKQLMLDTIPGIKEANATFNAKIFYMYGMPELRSMVITRTETDGHLVKAFGVDGNDYYISIDSYDHVANATVVMKDGEMKVLFLR